MSQSHPKSDSSLPEKNLTGILLLKKPGEGEEENPSHWYSSKIAGVPFILRNLLTLQRVGIKTLAVFYEDSNVDLQKSFDKILMDTRLSKKIVWIPNILKFKEWLQNSAHPVYIFNGAFLYDKKELFTLIHSEPNNINEAVIPINPDSLENLLIKTASEPSNLKPEAPSGFPLYVPGSHELQIQKPKDFKTLHVLFRHLLHLSRLKLLKGLPQSRYLHNPLAKKGMRRSIQQKSLLE